MIDGYCRLLNQMDPGNRSVVEIRDFLSKPLGLSSSFSSFANDFIEREIAPKSEGNAHLYRAAMKSFSGVFVSDDLKFEDITARHVKFWISKLMQTKRARESYPICVRQIWKSARKMFAEMYDDSSYNPLPDVWEHVEIPHSVVADRQPLSAEECRVFFSAPVPMTNKGMRIAKLGRDVAMMVLCLAGINTVDLYNMRKSNFRNGKFCYERTKTSRRRFDRAYIEIEVPEVLKPVIAEYVADSESESFFVFSSWYRSAKSFNISVNAGLRQMCESIVGLRRVYTSYLFRHTWATTAQNDCGASFSEIGFALNHLDGNRVTRGYVKPDFSKIWKLNERVIDFILFSDVASRGVAKEQHKEDVGFGISPKVLIRAAAFYRGRCVVSFEDIGYSSVDEVIREVAAQLPADLAEGAIVQVKVVNCDSGKVLVSEYRR